MNGVTLLMIYYIIKVDHSHERPLRYGVDRLFSVSQCH